MPVPDKQSLMLPVLKALTVGEETPISEIRERVATAEGLTAEETREMVASGQPRFALRVNWAVLEMRHAGLVERVRRANYRLTEEGKRLLEQASARVDLDRYPSYIEWSKKASAPPPGKDAKPAPPDESADTPEEALHHAVQQLCDALEAEVLDRVRKVTPARFEQVVLNLLTAMGYGSGDPAMGRVTGGSGDGGIDGTIKEDTLGLDEVYIQAKRYAAGNTIGAKDLRNFAGALDAAGTTKGVFVTTATFTSAAKDYVKRSPKRIVLIDGEELARLMVEHDIGVRTRIQHAIKRIDEDYFEQEAL